MQTGRRVMAAVMIEHAPASQWGDATLLADYRCVMSALMALPMS